MRMKRIVCAVLAALLLPVCAFGEAEPRESYRRAAEAEESGDYALALELYTALGDYEDSAARALRISSVRFADSIGEFSNGLAKVEKDGLYGCIDAEGNLVCAPRWIRVGDFVDGLAVVREVRDERRYAGYIDESWNVVIEPVWNDAYNFHGDYAKVSGEDGHCLIDRSGNVALDAAGRWSGIFDDLPFAGGDGSACWEGIALVYNGHISWGGLVDGEIGYVEVATGRVICEPQWSNGGPFSEGLAAVEKDGLWGFIDTQGNIVSELQWDFVFGFSEGLAAVEKDDLWGFIDTRGNIVSELQWDDVDYEGFSEGLMVVEKDGKCGYIDTCGNLALDCQWDRARSFSEGVAMVKKDGKWGLIDASGNEVVEPQWIEMWHYLDDLYVVLDGEKLGFMDSQGNALTELRWNSIARSPDENGYILVRAKNAPIEYSAWYSYSVRNPGERCGLIDSEMNVVVEPVWDDVRSTADGFFLVKDGEGWMAVDEHGEQIGDGRWDEVFSAGTAGGPVAADGLYRVKKDGLYGYLDARGRLAIPLQYGKANDFRDGVAAVRRDGAWYLIDAQGEAIY